MVDGRITGWQEGLDQGWQEGEKLGERIARILVPLTCILRRGASKEAQSLIDTLEQVSLSNEEDPEDRRAQVLGQVESKCKAVVANYLKQNKNTLSERELELLGSLRMSTSIDNKDF